MIEDRFWSKVALSDSCWRWTAAHNQFGYGMFFFHGRMAGAHRFSYELNIGPIPEGLTIDHLCRVRDCVRPDHLEAVTTRVNLLRGETLAARAAAKTHCPQGHPYTGEYLRRGKGLENVRACRPCHAAAERARYNRVKERTSGIR